MKRSVLIAIIVCIVALGALVGAAQGAWAAGFAPAVDYVTGSSPYPIALGDFNGDGRTDVATANLADSTVSVLLGTGDGALAPRVDYATGQWPESMAAADFNGDGDLDLATADYSGNTVSVLLGSGDGSFAGKVSFSTDMHPTSMTVGDFNGDGALDVATGNVPYSTVEGEPPPPDTVSVLLGDGHGGFAAKTDNVLDADAVGPIASADFNGDGILDLVVVTFDYSIYDPVSGANRGDVCILLGRGDGSFGPATDRFAAGWGSCAIALGDFNADAVPDVAVANQVAHSVSVLLGHGDGSLNAKVDYSTGRSVNDVTVADFNGDGSSDLAVVNVIFPDPAFAGPWSGVEVIGGASVLEGHGDGTFAAKVDYPTSGFAYCLAAGDLNGDGRQDLVVANSEIDTLSLLLGEATTVTTVAIGTNVLSEVEAVEVLFDTVQEAGLLTVNTLDAALDPPTGFQLAGSTEVYDISTTAAYSGPITVSLSYDDTGMTAEDEAALRLFHYEDVQWVDITTALDTEANVISGTCSSLSPFAIFAPQPDTAPPVTADDADGLWHNTDVAVHFSASDDLSGVTLTEYSLDDGVNWTAGSELTITNEGVTTILYRSVDAVGNVEQAKSCAVHIDKTAPIIAVLNPVEGADYVVGQLVFAQYTATDAASGVSAVLGTIEDGLPVPDGSLVDTSGFGLRAFVVTATDAAGNTTTETVTYGVSYSCGPIEPINPDGSSIFKRNRTLPLRLQIAGATGAPVRTLAPRIYLSQLSDNVWGSELEALSWTTPDEGNLFVYLNDLEGYKYNLDTRSLSTGTWRLRVDFGNGGSVYAVFSLR